MRTLGKAAVWAAAGVAAAATVTGITYAADTGTGSPGGSPSYVSQGTAGAFGSAGGHGRRLLRRLEHGQLTVDGKSGERNVLLQRGTVKSVSATSISITSPDGYAHTYGVSAQTKVRERSGRVGISAVHDGDHVFVIAVDGSARRILDIGTTPWPSAKSSQT